MSHDADVLTRLIGRLRGAAKGYRAAGSDGAVLFKDEFDARARLHDRTAEHLGDEVRSLGETPAAGGGPDLAPGAWSALGPALSRGPHAVAQAVEGVEAELLAAFHEAVDDPVTSGPVRDAIVRACDGVKAGHAAALQQLDAMGA